MLSQRYAKFKQCSFELYVPMSDLTRQQYLCTCPGPPCQQPQTTVLSEPVLYKRQMNRTPNNVCSEHTNPGCVTAHIVLSMLVIRL